MKRTKGSIMLLIATFFWGTTFVAQTTASDVLGTFTYNASRSFVGASFLGVLILLRHFFRKEENKETQPVQGQRSVLFAGTLCGVFLFVAMGCQQGGISAYPDGVAISGRSAFLTATYVIMTVICSRFLGKKLHKIVYAAVVVCVIGMYFLCVSDGISSIYLGDVLCLACALFFTIHIMIIDNFSYCDSVKMSCMQFVVAGILSCITALIFENPTWESIFAAAGSILYAGILSSGVAYTLQMAGQKYAEPAVASIVMSLESVFATLAGWILLSERLSHREMLGCALVFTAVILAQVPSFYKKVVQ